MSSLFRSSRREFLKLAGLGGVVFGSRLLGCGAARTQIPPDFYFVQLSDTHIGYDGPANPDYDGTLPKAIAAINALAQQPDFIIFTGDLTHTTDDANVRQMRLAQFAQLSSQLSCKTLYFMPGEHDAAPDAGLIYQQHFGALYYSFDYQGVHFATLDNVSDPKGAIGSTQLDWLNRDLAPLSVDQPIVIFAHRPLFNLYPQWEWDTPDGDGVINLLMKYQNVTVFYGHIHQENTFMTGNITHYAAQSLMFPLPAPGSMPTPTAMPVPWDPNHPYAGLGYRQVTANLSGTGYQVNDQPLNGG